VRGKVVRNLAIPHRIRKPSDGLEPSIPSLSCIIYRKLAQATAKESK